MKHQGKRLAEFFNSLNVSQLKFSKMVGIPQPYLSEILSEKKQVSRKVAEKVLKRFPDLNPVWFLTGSGSMLLHGEPLRPHVSKLDPFQYIKNVLYQDDKTIRKRVGSNISALISAWGMKKNDFFSLLIPGVQKQTVTNYLNGSSQIPLFALVYLEYITGISIIQWLTIELNPQMIPPHPLEPSDKKEDFLKCGALLEIRHILEKYGL